MDTAALPDGLIPIIKSTTRAAVTAMVAPGSTGPQRVEQLTGYSPGQISRWGGDAHKDLMPLEVVFLLEYTTQKPIFARALAVMTGHKLVPIEEGEGGDTTDLTRDMVDLMAAASALGVSYGSALADGKVTPREREDIRKAKERLQDLLVRARRNLADLPDAAGVEG